MTFRFFHIRAVNRSQVWGAVYFLGRFALGAVYFWGVQITSE
jgi:hypothetical protein